MAEDFKPDFCRKEEKLLPGRSPSVHSRAPYAGSHKWMLLGSAEAGEPPLRTYPGARRDPALCMNCVIPTMFLEHLLGADAGMKEWGHIALALMEHMAQASPITEPGIKT